MKNIFVFLIAFIAFSTSFASAQTKLVYVDAEYVFKHIPEYRNAETKLDELSKKWQEEVDAKYAEVEELYKSYQNDHSLLNESSRKKREDEIVVKERSVKEFQRQKFGFDGELQKERDKVLKPLEDRVAKVLEEYATENDLDLILDKASDSAVLFAKPTIDKSEDIIKKLGYTPDPSLKQ